MFKNYFKIAIRNIIRQKGYIFINVLGLSIGIACSILIFLFINYELSFDKYHEKSDRIYRIYIDGKIAGQEIQGAYTSSPLASTLKSTFPEVEDASRMSNWPETVIKYKENNFIEEAFIMADSSFFNIFSFPLIQGDPKHALTKPYTVVISESTANKIFGNKNPMGELLRVSSDTNYYEITGIMKDIPENTHFNCNMVASLITRGNWEETEWLNNNYITYLLLKEGATKEVVENKIPELLKERVGPLIEQFIGISFDDFLAKGNRYAYYLQPLTDIHLNTTIKHDLKPSHDKKYVFIFSIVGLMIIVIASINYMNLATARSASRSKEVGIRKVAGSSKRMLIKQFLSESILLTLISVLIALLLVFYLLPPFSNTIHIPLSFDVLYDWYLIPAILLVSIFIGVLAGSYPSFYLSSFKPTEVLYGKLKSGVKNGKIRSMLVVSQFIISIILITGTIIMFKQTSYMINKNLGFDKEQLFVIRRVHTLRTQIKSFKDEINKLPGVIASTHSTMVPGHENNNISYLINGRPKDELYPMSTNWADADFLKVYNIKMKEGSFFNEETNSTTLNCILNQAAIKDFNIDDPFNTQIQSFIEDGTADYNIVGVVNNFHIKSLHEKVSPFIFLPQNENTNWGYITIRLSSENIAKTIKQIEDTWKEFTNNEIMLSFFMDKEFEQMYNQEKTNSKLSVLFAIFAVIIASLGLFGLTSFTTEQRTKEIGIRKALGSSVTNIFYLISKDILKLVLIASVFAIPLSFYLFSNWLNNFYFRIKLSPFDFIWGVIFTAIISIITISYLALRAANTNPAKSLRYE